jgi:hypothetical protein
MGRFCIQGQKALMKISKTLILMIVFLLVISSVGYFLPTPVAEAATFTAVQNGNWETPSTWDLNQIPGSFDNVLIPASIAVSLDTPIAKVSGAVTVEGTLTLTNGGNLNSFPGTAIVNSGTLRNNGTIGNGGTFTNTGSYVNSGDFLNTGVLDNQATITNRTTGRIQNEVIGVINNNGTLTNNGTVFNACGAVITGNPIEGNPIASGCLQVELNNNDLIPDTQPEGNQGKTRFRFMVELSEASPETVLVDYVVRDGTATIADGDYNAVTSGTLIFPPTLTRRTIVVEVKSDTKVEEDETFTVRLTGVSGGNAELSPNNRLTGTIVNDDAVLVLITPLKTSPEHEQPEGNDGFTYFRFRIRLNQLADIPISVSYITSGGTAIPNEDYRHVNRAVEFAPGETGRTVVVRVYGDTVAENDETFLVQIFGPTNAVIDTTRSRVQAIILNDD